MPAKAKKSIVGLILALLLLGAVAAPGSAGTIAPELQALLALAGPEREIPVIVTLADRVDTRAVAATLAATDRSQRRTAMLKTLKERFGQNLTRSRLADVIQPAGKGLRGGDRVRNLWLINSLALRARPSQIRRIAQAPRVETVRIDEVITLSVTPAEFTGQAEWNIAAINAPGLWDLGHTGLGTVVASMDTGVDINHPDLLNRWRGGTNSWLDANNPGDPLLNQRPYDPLHTDPSYDGHGTAVMGIMVGGSTGGTAIGVAPGAQWIAVKIFDESGNALESEIHAGFQWLLDPDDNPDTDDAPDIVNNSWGFAASDNCFEGPGGIFVEDIRVLKQVGIALVFSAGNEGPAAATSVSPANYPESFAVGAVNEIPTVTAFSARGPSACDGRIYPDVVAPGSRAFYPLGLKSTALYTGQADPYTYVSGTSFAAPHVAGAMALLLSAMPGLSPEQLESALRLSALDLGPAGPDNAYGAGMIDVMAAYQQLADAVTITATTYDAGAGTLTVVAVSTAQPDVILTAEGYGALTWKSWKNFYRQTFTGVAVKPDSITVSSSGGGSDTKQLNDTVSITSLAYNAEAGALTVVAVSSAQPGVTLTAEGYGALAWKSWKNFYRNTFYGVTAPPAGVTVRSSGGGADVQPVPTP